MAKTRPRLKVLRRLGPLPGLSRKSAERRPNPPGQHGQRRLRKSEYRIRLEEKQKIRGHYVISETQLRRYFAEAHRRMGITGEVLLRLLERRLDNVAFRLGFAPTILAGRQLIVHGHVQVNGRRVDRPSYLVGVGDTVTLRTTARRIPDVVELAEHGPTLRLPTYLDKQPDFAGRVSAEPSREDVPFDIKESAVVEFYAR